MPENKHLKFLLVVIYVVLAYLFFVKIFPQVAKIIMPFLLAFVVASMTRPFVRFMRNKLKFPKWLASTVSLLVVWILIVGVVAAGINKVITELSSFINGLPDLVTSFTNTLKYIGIKWAAFTETISPEMSVYLNDFISNLTSMITSLISPITKFTFESATNIAFSLPSVFVFAVAFILSCIFMTNDYENLKGFLFNQIPESLQKKAVKIKKYTFIALGKYLRGMGIILCITFTELFIGLAILKVPYAFSIAILVALVDIFPIFGTGTVLIPWTVISLLSGEFAFAAGTFILYLVITVVRQFVEPKIMSQSLGTTPLITLFAMYVGLKLFGVWGMIFGPIVILILVYLQKSGVIKLWKEPPGTENNIERK